MKYSFHCSFSFQLLVIFLMPFKLGLSLPWGGYFEKNFHFCDTQLSHDELVGRPIKWNVTRNISPHRWNHSCTFFFFFHVISFVAQRQFLKCFCKYLVCLASPGSPLPTIFCQLYKWQKIYGFSWLRGVSGLDFPKLDGVKTQLWRSLGTCEIHCADRGNCWGLWADCSQTFSQPLMAYPSPAEGVLGGKRLERE